MLNIVLAGGGTAGHTSPLIATAKALQAAQEVSITCIGTAKGLETRVIPAAGLRLELITPVPLPRSISADLFKVPHRLYRSVSEAGQILKKEKADVLVGFGGYVSIPAYLAARMAGIPIVIHEANALPGLANRIGARWAKLIATTFPETPLSGAIRMGMPISRKISHPAIGRLQARKRFGLLPDAPTLLVSGGSQGAVRINEALLGARDDLLSAGVQILHVLGPKNFSSQDVVVRAGNGVGYHPVAFVDDMAEAYAAADFMVARSGAGTVVETSVSGVPCLFVPLPYGNGEQARNAADLIAAGGGVLVDNAELTPSRLLGEVLPRITDPEVLAQMSAACRGRTPSDAADRLADGIIHVASKDRS